MDKLKFIAISGTTNVTENMYVYDYKDDIIVIDCGVGFPPEATYGVDLVIPDFSYLVKNKNKVRAVFISHGHEDHFGALPFLLRDLKVPIYATPLVAGFINDKLADYEIRWGEVRVIDPERDQVSLGPFKVDPFRVTHSVPDSVGFCITTPVGKVFHVPDYKFDWTPVDGRPFDIAKVTNLGKEGVLALASDCLGATSEGYTKSEADIEKNFEVIIEGARSRVFFTTLSSNISRVQQAIRVSKAMGRKVVFVGRSIEAKSEIAKKLGYLYFSEEVASPKEAGRLPPNKLTFIISGSYGQLGSALYRLAVGEHDFLKIKTGDVFIFSADPAPPGTEQTVNYVVDNLIGQGAELHYYDTQEDLHVSGHGSQKEIEMLFALVRPRYLIPIGGTVRHMRAYSGLAQKMGWKSTDVFELRAGDTVEFEKDRAVRGQTLPVKTVLVDGLGVGDVGNVVLRDRKTLSREGIVITTLQIDKQAGSLVGKPELISRGFIFAKEQQALLDEAEKMLVGQIKRRRKRGDGQYVKKITVDFLEHFFFERTGRRPMILPIVVEV